MSDKVLPGDKIGAGMTMAAHDNGNVVGAPAWLADVECVGPDGTKWTDRWQNAVQFQGKVDIMNRYFGQQTNASMSVWYLGLHSYTNATASILSGLTGITASEVGGYGANRQSITISTFNTNVYTTTASFGFTTSTYTVSGLLVAGNSVGSTASATAGTAGIIYSAGNFNAGSRQVQSADTLNVTLTLSMA
jgi:hypothetical protein